jgi:hypothetical protein
MNKNIVYLFLCILALTTSLIVLALACGGGGGSDDDHASDDDAADDDAAADDDTACVSCEYTWECQSALPPGWACLNNCCVEMGDDDSVTSETSWTDTDSGLTWQNGPQLGSVFLTWDEAKTYCNGLSWDGQDDWRLPTISELRSLIRGCSDTMTGGACGVTDDCLDNAACWSAACAGCLYMHGPGFDGGYWPVGIQGYPDRYCSASPAVEADNDHAWFVHFGAAEVYSNGIDDHASVRCVR